MIQKIRTGKHPARGYTQFGFFTEPENAKTAAASVIAKAFRVKELVSRRVTTP